MFSEQSDENSRKYKIMAYALKSCLLMKTALIPVITAIILRIINPYTNRKNVELSKTDGNRRLEIRSSQRAHTKCGFRFRSYAKSNEEERFIINSNFPCSM